MINRGVIYIAYGKNAMQAAAVSIKSLLQHNDLPVMVITDGDLPSGMPADRFFSPQADSGGRWQKTRLAEISPYDQSLYIDADTVINGSIMAGFDALQAGFDLVMVPSTMQGTQSLHHVDAAEREYTQQLYAMPDPLQWQAGVMWWQSNASTAALWDQWHLQWLEYEDQDQAALLRALYSHPVKLHILGHPFNSPAGSVIDHQFGRAR